MLSHFILQPPEELEVKLFEAVAVWGDEVEAAVYATINLGGIIITISFPWPWPGLVRITGPILIHMNQGVTFSSHSDIWLLLYINNPSTFFTQR